MLLPSLIAAVVAPQVAQAEAVLHARIGAPHGSPAAFGRVVDIAVDREGNAYVLDNQESRVDVFSSEGGHLRSFGRRGGGPDELNRPIGIDVRDGIVTVLNPSGHSSSYTLEGEPVTSQRMPFGTQRATRISEGRYVVRSWGGISREAPSPIESLLVVGPEVLDTVLKVPSSDILFRGPMANAALPTTLCRLTHFAVGSEGELWVASGVEGTLTELGPADGSRSPRRSVSLAPKATPLPDSTRARLLGHVPQQLQSSPGDLYLPSNLSSICGLERTHGGTLWVRLEDVDERERWVELDGSTLDPVWEVTLPEGVAIMAFSDRLAYGIGADEAGSPQVMIYRVE